MIAVVRENSHNLEKLQGQNVKIVFCNLSNMSSLPQLIEDRDIILAGREYLMKIFAMQISKWKM